jgi:hypothetical protein
MAGMGVRSRWRLGWRHVVPGMRVRLRWSHLRHVVTRMRVNGQGLGRHLLAGMGVRSRWRLGRRHGVSGVGVLFGRLCRRLGHGSRGGSRLRWHDMARVCVLSGGAQGASGQDQRSEGEGETVHDAAPSMGRTVTTLNMPACICMSM